MQARQLVIEATESMLMQSTGPVLEVLHGLRALGLQLSIDDFGTGYSSLTYLKRFPCDKLKIDQTFVAAMTRISDDAAIVTAIVSLGQNMHRRIVAEGVETVAQATALRALGCNLMQGFLFSRPLPADEMTALLRLPHPFAWAAKQTAQQAAAECV